MITRPRVVVCAVFFALLAPVSAFAQDAPKAGLVAATPGSLAFIYQFSERVAVKPTFLFTHSSTNIELTDSETDASTVAPGVSVLFYTQKWDAVRAYVSPAYEFSHSTSSFLTPTTSGESSTNTNSLSGSVGAQYDPHRHFGAFGEVGLVYSHRSTESLGSLQVMTGNTWNVRAVVGAIFFF